MSEEASQDPKIPLKTGGKIKTITSGYIKLSLYFSFVFFPTVTLENR